MFKKLNSITWCVVCCIVLFISACEKNEKPLRISINAWPGYEFLYLAEQKGFFREEGANVQLVQLDDLSDATRAFERGNIDGMATTLIDVLQSRNESKRLLQVVQVVDYSNGADLIISQSGIHNMAQLKGKRVGLELASLGVYVLDRALEKSGLKMKDVEILSSQQSDMEALFANNQLDAVVTYPPTSIKLLSDSKANILFSSASIPGEVLDVLAFDQSIVDERPEEIAGIIRAFYRAQAYTQVNPDESYRIMAEREGITPNEFKEAMQNEIHMLTHQDQGAFFTEQGSLIKTLQQVDKTLRETHQLQVPVNLHQLINSDPLSRIQ